MMKKLSTIFCLFLMIGIHTTKAQGVLAADSMALVDLYHATDGNNWSNNGSNNWLERGQQVRTWAGVTVTGNRVTQLSLFGLNLSGSIPSSLGNLTNLIHLLLHNNNLSGTVPETFTALVSLSEFRINDNPLLCAPTTTAYNDWAFSGRTYSFANTCVNRRINLADSMALVDLYKLLLGSIGTITPTG